jgi:hypothetical protein
MHMESHQFEHVVPPDMCPFQQVKTPPTNHNVGQVTMSTSSASTNVPKHSSYIHHQSEDSQAHQLVVEDTKASPLSFWGEGSTHRIRVGIDDPQPLGNPRRTF